MLQINIAHEGQFRSFLVEAAEADLFSVERQLREEVKKNQAVRTPRTDLLKQRLAEVRAARNLN